MWERREGKQGREISQTKEHLRGNPQVSFIMMHVEEELRSLRLVSVFSSGKGTLETFQFCHLEITISKSLQSPSDEELQMLDIDN